MTAEQLISFARGAPSLDIVDVEGLSYEEAAAVLGVPIGTVRSRLFRGRRLIQDQLFIYARDAGFATAREPSAIPAVPPPRPSTRHGANRLPG